MRGVELVVSGTAEVYCVHDRVKRLVKDKDAALYVARQSGLSVKDIHRVVYQTCACCDNVFGTFDKTPRFCYGCERPLVHALGGPLEQPTEEVIH